MNKPKTVPLRRCLGCGESFPKKDLIRIVRTPEGEIAYLPNPHLQENLAFCFQMQLACGRYPGFARKIYLKGLRYNLHLRGRSSLIEAGAQTNTKEEVWNAMELLAEVVDTVLDPVTQK